MLYMIQVRYLPEQRKSALGYFWEHGATHYEGKVAIENLWVATHEGIAYALVEAADEVEAEKACSPLREFGEVEFHQVTNADEI